MNLSIASVVPSEVRGLVQAIAQNGTSDGLNLSLAPTQWNALASYMQQFSATPGQTIVEPGDLERNIYLVEAGSLSVHAEDSKGRIRLAMVSAGSVVGECGFFSMLARTATVQAAGPTTLWCLTPTRFAELSNRQPAIALQVSMALASVLAKRLRNRSRRVAAT